MYASFTKSLHACEIYYAFYLVQSYSCGFMHDFIYQISHSC